LKAAVTEAINNLLEPIRKKWKNDPEFQKITGQAYPELKKNPIDISKLGNFCRFKFKNI